MEALLRLARANRLHCAEWVPGVGSITPAGAISPATTTPLPVAAPAVATAAPTPTPEPSTASTTIAVTLDKVLVQPEHVERVRDAAERAHAATRLASRLLNFHALRCLERGLPLPAFGSVNWSQKAWHLVTRASRFAPNRDPDAELASTFDEFMRDTTPVDSTKLVRVMQFEAQRWSVSFSTNVYVHFASRVKRYVRTAFFLSKEALRALDKPARLRRKTELTKVAYDLCSPPTSALTCPEAYHGFVRATRARWRLDAFPWDDKPLAYHLKADSATKPTSCRAHLLLPALWHMRIQRQVHDQKGFALVPLRTTLVPRHTHFGNETLRSLLGVGLSEHLKAASRERDRKRRKGDSGAGSSAQHAAERDEDEPDAAGPKKRKRRPKEETDAERRKDLERLFDLKKAGVHDVRDKRFECTFTSDGVSAHLRFSKPDAAPIDENAIPTRGIYDVDDLARRLRANGVVRGEPDASTDDPSLSPKAKVDKLCICCDGAFRDPLPGFVCVGCDPGRNEPVCMVDPLSRAKLRMTATGRRHHCNSPGKFARTARHALQSNRKGKAAEHGAIEAAAAAYRAAYVDKPAEINRLECEVGLEGCATAPYLLHFGRYVDALKAREATLVPHYAQLHHRRLRRKAHVETQRFESRFVRDVKRTFDPNREGKTIVLAWGCWGKIAGRAGTPGNKGRPSTIGVGLARRIAKERGIVVAWTPEHDTTKTHFGCGAECARFAQAEQRRADDRTRRSHGDEVCDAKEIRGLKVCQNPACRAPVNRDLNAAKNIAANGLLLLTGHSPIRVHTPEEAALTALENDMQSA